jgi:hypothetical protein
MLARAFKSLFSWSRRQIEALEATGEKRAPGSRLRTSGSSAERDLGPEARSPKSGADLLRIAAASATALPIGRRFVQSRGELGLMQRWYASQPTQRIVISVLELHAPVARDLVELAVRGLCARHPSALGVCVERSRTRLHVRPLTAADAVPWFDSADRDSWALAGADAAPSGDRDLWALAAADAAPSDDRDLWALAVAMLHFRFSTGAPLFRVALSSDGRHVVTAFDHLIADGVSAAIFAAELGSFLAGDALLPAAADAALPLDARLDLRPSIGVLARAFRGAADKAIVLTPNPASAGSQGLNTQIIARAFSRDLVDSLVGAAHRHAVTLHAVMSSAALHAASEVLDADRGTLRLTTPVSLRDQCRPKPDGIGVFIASIDTDLNVSMSDDPWVIARRCRAAILRDRPNAHRTLGLLAFAGDLEALAAKYERKPHGRTATVEVSNVGRVIGVPHGAAVWLTQGAHYHAALFVLTVATSDSDGALRCCLSFPEPLIDGERADRFMRAFERRLVAMCES